MDTTHPVRIRYLLAPPARPWAGALLTVCAGLVAVLGVIFAHQTAADRFDRAVDAPVITWFGHHPGLAGWLALPGSLMPMAALSVAIAAVCLRAGRLNGAVLAVAAVPVTAGLFDRTYLGVLSYRAGIRRPCSRWPRPWRCCCSPVAD